MSIDVGRINTELQSLHRRFDIDRLNQARLDAVVPQLTSRISTLGTQVNQVLGGFQSLTQELDIPTADLEQAVTQLRTAAGNFDGVLSNFGIDEQLQNIDAVVDRGITMLTADPPNIQITNAVSELNSSLEALTESTVGGGFLNLAVTANTPEAMARTISRVSGVALTEVDAALEEILPAAGMIQAEISGLLSNLQNELPVINDLVQEVSDFAGRVNNVLGVVSQVRGLLTELTENLGGNIQQTVRGLLRGDVTISDQLLNDVIENILTGSIEEAAQQLLSLTNLSLDSLLDELNSIDTSPSANLEGTGSGDAGEYVPGVNPTRAPESPDTTPTNNTDAVYAVLSSVDRDITELVVRTVSYEHPEPAPLSANYPTWHFIVQASGTIIRPAAMNDELTDAGDHNQYSIGVVIAARNGIVTPDQTRAIDSIMESFLSIIPYGQVINFEEISADVRASTIFDARGYAREHFNVTTVVDASEQSLSTAELSARFAITSAPPPPEGEEEEEYYLE